MADNFAEASELDLLLMQPRTKGKVFPPRASMLRSDVLASCRRKGKKTKVEVVVESRAVR